MRGKVPGRVSAAPRPTGELEDVIGIAKADRDTPGRTRARLSSGAPVRLRGMTDRDHTRARLSSGAPCEF